MAIPKLIRRLTADVDVTKEKHVEYEQERFVPISTSPFKDPTEEKDDSRPSEAQSAWLEISGDLAWTATFSSLTSNTSVSAHSKVSSYAVFFALVWHLWATQISYDTRYYTNDWYHRMAFLVRLSVYAALAAFSKSFNVFWKIAYTNQDGFSGGADPADAQAIMENADRTDVRTFKAFNLILMISRLLLLLSYIRVLYYRFKAGTFKKRHLLVPISLGLAATSFLLAFIMICTLEHTRRIALAQFALWGFAVVVQIGASLLTPKDDEGVLKNDSKVESRLSTLTVIILGEGLNGICATLSIALAPLGLAASTLGDGVALAFILYFLWLLYFDVYATLARAVTFFERTFTDYVQTGNQNDVPLLKEISLSLGQSWTGLVQKWNDAAQQNGNSSVFLQEYQWYVESINAIFQAYQQNPDDKANYLYNQYIDPSNMANFTADANDSAHPLFQEVLDRFNTVTSYSCHWVRGISGLTLIVLAILNAIHRRPEDRYVWSYVWIRLAAGLVLAIIGFSYDYWLHYDFHMPWFIGSIAVVLAVAGILDQLALYFSVRTIKKKLPPPGTAQPRPEGAMRPTIKSTFSEAKSEFSGTSGSNIPSLRNHSNRGSMAP